MFACMISVRLNWGRHKLVSESTACRNPPFLSTWLSQLDAGAQEPDATADDSYYTGGAYYYVKAADDDQE